MKLSKIITLVDAISDISEKTETYDPRAIIVALTDLCWDEEEAGELLEHFEEGEYENL